MSARRRRTRLALALALSILPIRGLPAESPVGSLRTSVGPPSAPHAMPGVDAQRSRRTSTRLASEPAVKSRLRVAYGVGRGMVVHDDGDFTVAHPAARLSRFDALGRLVYSMKLNAEPSSAPVVTSSGLVAFVVENELLFVDDRGRLRHRTRLGAETAPATRSILATRDGGVLIASGSAAYKVSGFGNLEWRRPTSSPILEVLEAGPLQLAVSEAGSVFELRPGGTLHPLGELGAATGAVTLAADGRRLLARSGRRRIASFDVRQRRLDWTAEDLTLDFDGPVLLSADGHAAVFTADGLLVRLRPDGSELQRVPADPGARQAPGLDLTLLLADGRLILARVGADAAVIHANGEVTTISGSRCPDPAGVYPGAGDTVLVAGRSGHILRIE